MKGVVIGILVVTLLGGVAVAPVAAADFWGGFAAGAGALLGLSLLTMPYYYYLPPPVYYPPAPVYSYAPVCQDLWVEGRWEIVPQSQGNFVQYFPHWVPGRWQRVCR